MRRIFTLLVLVAALAAAAGTASGQRKGAGTISGRFLDTEGRPVSGAVVLFYNEATGPPPDPQGYWRIPDQGDMLSADGGFITGLAPGRYFVGVIKDPGLVGEGQPKFEDWLYLDRSEDGHLRRHEIEAGANTELGNLTISGPLAQDSGPGPEPAPALELEPEPHGVAVEGTVVDSDGSPVADVIVEATVSGEKDGKTLFSSERTADDGKFFMRTAFGTYYLRVRNVPPRPGAAGEKAAAVSASSYRIKETTELTAVPGEKQKILEIEVVKEP